MVLGTDLDWCRDSVLIRFRGAEMENWTNQLNEMWQSYPCCNHIVALGFFNKVLFSYLLLYIILKCVVVNLIDDGMAVARFFVSHMEINSQKIWVGRNNLIAFDIQMSEAMKL